MSDKQNNAYKLEKDSLNYHLGGKLAVKPTTSLASPYNLSLAQSPGVAYPCLHINANNFLAQRYTNKSNSLAVISNGTAVLGLGNLGALSSKPVMEGKGVLFKMFGNIDATDLCIEETDKEEFVKIVSKITASQGGINLEDIKAPECFQIEQQLKELVDIPVMHDDQHGTAVIVFAGIINALKLQNKKIWDIKIVVNGAGAAALSIHNLLTLQGADRNKILVCDTKGVVYKGRKENMNQYKDQVACDEIEGVYSLEDALQGADVFIGVSVEGALKKEWAAKMSDQPVVFALANPVPEIWLNELEEVKDNFIYATGRSDFMNQVNNVLAFPQIFRGAMDTYSKQITDKMKLAAALAIADLAREHVPGQIKQLQKQELFFGNDQIIPKPFDQRLGYHVSLAVAKAAIEEGVTQLSFPGTEDDDSLFFELDGNCALPKSVRNNEEFLQLLEQKYKHMFLHTKKIEFERMCKL